MCALSGSLGGSDNDEIMCAKYGPYEDLFARLRRLGDDDCDLLEGIPSI